MRKLFATVVSLLLLCAAAAGAATPAEAALNPITGSGSTWSQNALDQWRTNVRSNYGLGVNYTGVGSTAGRKDFINGMVDFAISEIPFQEKPTDNSEPERPTRGFAYMPIVAGGTSLMYNLKIGGKRVTNLRLSGEVVAKIFTGQITTWNDPAIQADNPALAMPEKPITPIIRSDGSGTSAQFTLWMSKQFPGIWKGGMTSQFPSFGSAKAQKGSDGVAGYISQSYGEGAIGYVEYSYAKNAKFPVVKLLNQAGYYVEPTALSVAVALTKAGINADLTQNLDAVYTHPDARAYPMSSYSYAIVPTAVGGIFTEKKGESLGVFLRYVLCEGQQTADPLGYSPLPGNLVIAGSDQIKRIPGAGGQGVDLNKCNNPTFKDGDASGNYLAKTAPMPKDCDKKGDTQCVGGTAGAKSNTSVTGKGKGVDEKTGQQQTSTGGSTNKSDSKSGDAGGKSGESGSQPGSDSSTAPGADATAGSNPDGATNPDGTTDGGAPSDPDNPDSGTTGSGGGGSGGGATSVPYKMAKEGFGTSQWLMLASVVLLGAAVGVPPLLFKRFGSGS